MDGVPVFNLVRETMPAVTILGFRGVVNSTTNFILTAMEQGQPFDEALAEMQARGIAEADASLDVDGWDAAAKTAALANVLLERDITPHAGRRVQGISRDTAARAIEAREPRAAAEAGGARVARRAACRGACRTGGTRRRRSAGAARRPAERAHPVRRICSAKSRSCSGAAA